MPVHVSKRKSGYAVVDSKGKVHGTHKSKAKATAQAQAINISTHKKKNR